MIPKVSVIMPVYNAERYLSESIDSILMQSFDDFELIVIDDSSTDSSLKIIQSYNNPKIKLLINEKNIGSAGSMNRGLSVAVGEYVARMDADDISLPDRLETQVKYMDNNVDVCLSGTWVQVVGDKHLYDWRYNTDPEELRARLLFDCPFAHPSIIFRREVVCKNNLQYREGYRRAEDYDFYTRIVEFGKISNIPRVLVKYRLHPNQTSNILDNEYKACIIDIHRFQLSKINLTADNERILLHQKISDYSYAPSDRSIKQISDWLTEILNSNSKYNYFSNSALNKVIAVYWYSMLLKLIKINKKTAIKTFVISQTSRTMSIEQKLKFIIKCLYVW